MLKTWQVSEGLSRSRAQWLKPEKMEANQCFFGRVSKVPLGYFWIVFLWLGWKPLPPEQEQPVPARKLTKKTSKRHSQPDHTKTYRDRGTNTFVFGQVTSGMPHCWSLGIAEKCGIGDRSLVQPGNPSWPGQFHLEQWFPAPNPRGSWTNRSRPAFLLQRYQGCHSPIGTWQQPKQYILEPWW